MRIKPKTHLSRQEFVTDLDNLFDIAHADALKLIKIDEDRIFLQRQREPGRPGHLAGVDKKLADKEEKSRLRNIEEQNHKEQLIAVPKLDNSTGSEQAEAIRNAVTDWNLEDKVQILCCDTTASNTGRINGACVLLEQKFNREMLIFGCRHHIYELVLKGVFEDKISQVTNNPDIPLFKKFRDNWKNIDPEKIQNPTEIISCLNVSEVKSLLEFYRTELTKNIVRDDYRYRDELIELSIIFLGGDTEKKFKIRPPGAMHQARWMARALYSLKICLLSSQFKISNKDKVALLDVCMFIVTCYVKPWLQCILAVKTPNQDLCFLKTMKEYEKVDKTISKAALQKFSQHLWYLTYEVAVLSLFDDDVDHETKIKIVQSLSNENHSPHNKRYVPSKEDLCGSLYEKDIDNFTSVKSKALFDRFKIDDSFLPECPTSWSNNAIFLQVKAQMLKLRAVNDTAERAVKLMQDFHGKITVDEEQKQFLLRCIQEHRVKYPDCRRMTLKRKF
ncbi:unnamed protein product [Spodoptera littoralis]|uniref:Uncharacterized protein n=1 Tax=Spodoptera littoralis TaxID=7109 RepID=A0A9P0IJX0_SPOLI|nr:unnamed protein product [Spodoptera littoralis]CAH1647379.1 unnamed protein product [Spodoptera littoralis]